MRFARRNQWRTLGDTRRAIRATEKKAHKPTRDVPGVERGKAGYADREERHHKLRRAQKLRARHVRIASEIESGPARLVRGGKKLLKSRLHLEEAPQKQTAPRKSRAYEKRMAREMGSGEDVLQRRWRVGKAPRQRVCARSSERCGVQAIVVEDLGFDDARSIGRETMGRGQRGKRFRRNVAGIPTAKFRRRLVALASHMGITHGHHTWASHMGIAVVAADPAYTSKWGGEHWNKPLSTEKREVSRHEAAAIVIGEGAACA